MTPTLPNKLIVLCLLLAGLLTGMPARAAEPAAYVLMASGEVRALQTNQQTRELKRRSPLYPGESVITGVDAKAQLRFRDGALISLRAQTEIRLDEFRFDEPYKGEDKNIFSLVSGGFRTITGKIGKQNPDNYRMKSSVASIGVRGTTYEVVLDHGLNVAAWQGSIVVENEGGRMTLGAEGRYNFAVVNSPRAAPRGTMKPPAAIAAEQQGGMAEDDTEEQGADAEQTDGDEQTEAEDGETESSDDAPSLSTQPLVEETVQDATAIKTVPDTSTPDSCDGQQGGDPCAETLGGESFTVTGDGSTTDPATTDPGTTDPGTTTDPNVDQRVVGVTLDRVGMAVLEGAGTSQMLAGGQAGQDTDGTYYIGDNGLDPSETGFDSTAFIEVLTQGQAPLGAGLPLDVSIDANHTVTLGVWEADALTPAQRHTDATDASVFSAVEQPVYWIVGAVTPATAFASRSGQVDFRNVLGFLGGGSGGAVTDLYMNLSINFDTLAASGAVHIYTANELWQLSLSGSLNQPVLDFTSVSGTVNGSAVQGEFNSLFSGDTAQALFSSFDLEAVGNPAIYLSGVAVVDDSAVGDLRLSATELASLDRVGLALRLDGQSGAQWWLGPASAGALNDGPLMVDNGVSPADPGFASAPPLVVLRDESAYLSASYEDPNVPVSWGLWQTGLEVQVSAFDPKDTLGVSEPVRWMTVLPTQATVIAGRSGTARFAPIFSQGADHNGAAFMKFFVGLELELDLAQFHGSGAFETAGNDRWHFFFDGSLNGPELVTTTLDGFYEDSLGNESAIAGELAMLLTGSAAEAIAGAYEFELGSDATQYIAGNFLLGEDLRLSDTEVDSLDRYGVAMKSTALAGREWIAGLASDGSLGQPIIGENFSHSGDPHFSDLPLSSILKRGTATTQIVTSDGGYPVSWGIWNGGAELYTDPGNAGLVTPLVDPLVWMTVLPSDHSVLAGRGGKGFYFERQCCTGGYFGRTETGYGIDNLSFDLGLDFDSGRFSGRLYVYEADTDSWNVLFGGELMGTQLQLSAVEATSSYYNYSAGLGSSGVDGDLSLVLTGNNAQALAVAFEFESASDSAYFVQGAFVAEQDLRLSALEMSDLRRVALTAGWNAGLGMATTAPTAPVIVADGMGSYLPGDPWFELATLQTVMRQGSAPADLLGGHAVAADPAYQVDWGRWNAAPGAPGSYQYDPADAALQNDITAPLYWLTLTPTPVETLAAMSGQLSYSAPVAIAAGSVGATGDGGINPASFSFNATLDFDTGMLSSGTMYVEHLGGQSWDMNFSTGAGALTPSGALQYVSASGLYNATDTASGSLDLMLTGANAEGLAGRFSFSAFSGVSKDLQGVFLVC